MIAFLGLISPLAFADVTGDDVRRAIAAAVRQLERRQHADGSWTDHAHPGGMTCLATLALVQAGVPLKSDTVTRAIEKVRRIPNQATYVVSLKVMALATADPAAYFPEIRDAAEWLVAAQNPDGLWTYGRNETGTGFDHSNSQFALLGLHAASQAGVKIPKQVWLRAREAVAATQNRDGGWCYNRGAASYGSMTAANVSNLLILGAVESVSAEQPFRNGHAPGCGRYQTDKRLAAGLAWLGRNFSARQNPGAGPEMYTLYWLYAVERVGILSGRRYFGNRDWYREGAEYLVRSQAGGGWGTDLANTCFGLLFLAKGHKPLLIQKLIWSENNDWNPDRHDLERLTAFIGDKFGEPVAWQAVAYDAPLEEWLAAPLLYMQGHDFPNWTPAKAGKVREYIERGGVLFAEACCGGEEFDAGFRRFAERTFAGHPLRILGREHAVYGAHYKLDPQALEGIDIGCRTSVIYSPRDLSCLWEQSVVPDLSEGAFRLGTNIAAYAAGRGKLRDRLDAVKAPVTAASAQAAAAPLDALRLTQIVYTGDWQPDPRAIANLTSYLRDSAGLDVVVPREIGLTDASLSACPIIYITGHYEFSLSQGEFDALHAHLRRGGFLLMDACCGRREFDSSARKFLERLAAGESPAGSRIELLNAEHDIFRGQPGFPITNVAYRPRVLDESPGLSVPRLYGMTIDGRLAAVYSPYGLGCGWDGHECGDCRGLMPEDARRLGANIILHALTR